MEFFALVFLLSVHTYNSDPIAYFFTKHFFKWSCGRTPEPSAEYVHLSLPQTKGKHCRTQFVLKTRINEEASLRGFPACPVVVQYYTLRKAGSWQKQRSWNSHEAVWWCWWWWWQRGSREKLLLSLILQDTSLARPPSASVQNMFSLSSSLLLHDVSLQPVVLPLSTPFLLFFFSLPPSLCLSLPSCALTHNISLII